MRTRRWFQIHLFTALALMLSAAALLWLNLQYSPGLPYVADYDLSGDAYDPVIKQYPSVGWPRSFLTRNASQIFLGAFTIANAPTPVPIRLAIQMPQDYKSIHAAHLALDLAVALLILICVGLLCEWRLRAKSR